MLCETLHMGAIVITGAEHSFPGEWGEDLGNPASGSVKQMLQRD